MNDVVKKLMLEAGYAAPELAGRANKLSELIVRECIGCCDEVDRINKAYIEEYCVDPENGPKECIQVIKAHFGVEE